MDTGDVDSTGTPTPADSGDTVGATDDGSTSAGSTDGGSTDGGSTDGGSTDGGSTDGGSTDGGSTDGGSSGGGSTDGGSSGGGSTGGMPGNGFGDCVNNDEAVACTADELCVTDNPGAPTVGVCTEIGCMDAGDCAMAPPGGNAPVECGDINGDGMAEECFIDCSMGQDCPTDMECFLDFVCVWPADDGGGSTDGGSSTGGGGLIPGGSCCIDNSGAPGCDVPEIEACVCAIDGFCCDTEWDGICVDQAVADCNADC